MNEQIKELIEQSRTHDKGYFIYQYGGPNGHQSVEKAIDLEKFSELLILKCMEIVSKRANGLTEGHWVVHNNAVWCCYGDIRDQLLD